MPDIEIAPPHFPPSQKAIRAKCFHPSRKFVEFTKEEIEQSIPDRFEQIVRKHPDSLALKSRIHAFTYAELNQAANRIAHALLALTGESQEPVGLLFENGAPFVIASLAALKAGKIQVPLESHFPRARLKYVLEQSQAGVLVTDNANLSLARELTELPLINIDEIDGHFSIENPEVCVAPDAVTSIAYTSGSTGQPKGIIWNHRGVLHAVMHHTNTSQMCLHDRLVMFRASLRAHLYALLNGATFYPVDLHQEEPARLAEWLIQEDITVYRAAVSAFRSLGAALTGTEKFPHLRLILLFGEPTYHTEVELYRKCFSDRCVLATSLGCNEFGDYAYYFLDKDSPLPSSVVPGGYPIEGAEILFLDDDGRVSAEQIGEIAIRSGYGAVGYWRRPDLTQAAFLPGPAGGDERIYRTGDLGRMRADGCLFHLGRKDFQVKIRGHRVEVAEVETTLLEIERVKEAVVVGWEDTPGNKRLVAYITPAGPHMPNVHELRRVLSDKLPDYMVPFTFIMLDHMPLTATGKVDRRALPAPDSTRPALETPFLAARTSVEEKLAGIWAEVLGLDRVGVHDSFLELGGDSLLATRVVSRVLSQFQIRVPLRLLFEAPTVAEMAAVIVELDRKDREAETRPGTPRVGRLSGAI
jgi:amino acid adenylation domain-containing protein